MKKVEVIQRNNKSQADENQSNAPLCEHDISSKMKAAQR